MDYRLGEITVPDNGSVSASVIRVPRKLLTEIFRHCGRPVTPDSKSMRIRISDQLHEAQKKYVVTSP